MQGGDRLFLEIVSLYPHSHQETNSLLPVESLRIQIVEGGRNTGHVYHHKSNHAGQHQVIGMLAVEGKPTLIGASSSSKIGCDMKISLAFVHKKRISVSLSCTCFPGRFPLTSNSFSMMASRSTSCWSAMLI